MEVHSELRARFDPGDPAGKIRRVIKLDLLKGESGAADRPLGIKPYNHLWESFHTCCHMWWKNLIPSNEKTLRVISPTFKSKACWSFRR